MAKDHLISLLFRVFAKYFSLCEVSGAMPGLSGNPRHFQPGHIPYRSTLSDVNKRQSVDFFCSVYHDLLREYGHVIPDIRFKKVINKQIRGVPEDAIIGITVKEDNDESRLKLRKVVFYDRVLKHKFGFLTNLFGMRPNMIVAIYKIRWQIELLYKQLEKNFPLRYFPGDNENAIKAQIYCVLIVNLLLTVIQKRLKRP